MCCSAPCFRKLKVTSHKERPPRDLITCNASFGLPQLAGGAKEEQHGGRRLHNLSRVRGRNLAFRRLTRVSLSVGCERSSGLISRSLVLRGAETLGSILEAST
ncbi:hypothetical protein E2C01_012992 [Portunus trituberculatus]|uniref:Uncharacterized protein n=1 Tax=Portunus trituberculatus TaxID=210409 RepID=A0A5B7DF24_PORTR|nr:hypothetical protein [Portunus trituberculatus]